MFPNMQRKYRNNQYTVWGDGKLFWTITLHHNIEFSVVDKRSVSKRTPHPYTQSLCHSQYYHILICDFCMRLGAVLYIYIYVFRFMLGVWPLYCVNDAAWKNKIILARRFSIEYKGNACHIYIYIYRRAGNMYVKYIYIYMDS